MKWANMSLLQFGNRRTAMGFLCLLLLAMAALAWADGPYEIHWYTVDGGGGTSRGGPYVLTGTIGQPDAGYSAGGNYQLFAGFWAGEPSP